MPYRQTPQAPAALAAAPARLLRWLRRHGPSLAGRAPPLGRLLRFLIALALLPSALLATGVIWYAYDSAVTRTRAQTQTAARAISADVDRHFIGTKTALQALASSPTLSRGELAEFHAQATQFLAATDLALNVFVVAPNGEQLVNTFQPADAVLPPVPPGNRGLARLVAGAPMAVSDFYRGPVTGTGMVAVAVPRHVDGTLRYVVAAGVDTARLSRILEGAHLPSAWTVSILDSRGVIAARLPRRDEFVGQSATVELLQAIDRSNEGFFLGRTKEGTVVRAVFSRARESGYVVAIGIPERDLLAPLRTAAALLAATLAAVLALALAAASRVSRRIASSAAELAAEAVQIGKSTPGEAPRLFFLEADQVRLGIKIATAELQQSAAELRTAHADQEAARLADVFSLVDAAMEPMLVMDGALVIRRANEAAASLLQRPGSQLVGMKLREVVWGVVEPTEAPQALHAFLPDGSQVPVRINRSVITIGTARYLVLAIKQLADAGE